MVPRNQLKRRVLIVDNEPDITFVFKMGLEDKGFIVDAFEDPVLALSNFKSNYYDIILLDIGMPQMNGFELYENIINIDNNAKICFLTASEALHANLIEKYLKTIEPAHPCLIAKPIEMDDLVEKVNKEIMNS